MHAELPAGQHDLWCNALETKGLHEDQEVGLGQPLVKHGVAKLTNGTDGVELLINCDGEINGQRASHERCAVPTRVVTRRAAQLAN